MSQRYTDRMMTGGAFSPFGSALLVLIPAPRGRYLDRQMHGSRGIYAQTLAAEGLPMPEPVAVLGWRPARVTSPAGDTADRPEGRTPSRNDSSTSSTCYSAGPKALAGAL